MRGNITRRGKASWRLKFDAGRDPATGKRLTKFVTVRGTKRSAEKELSRLLTAADTGMLVDPSKVTVAEYLTTWITEASAQSLSPKTAERYRGLIDKQIVPHLGKIALQKLRPSHLADWYSTLLRAGRADGGPLAARTAGHAGRVLHKALARAAATEMVSRNVAALVSPPTVPDEELEILTADQIADVIAKIRELAIFPIAFTALATGARRGELLALRWTDVDLDGAKLRVERSLEQTKAGLRFKSPKTKNGRRSISLPPEAVGILRNVRREQAEYRLALGLGRAPTDALVFPGPDGAPRSPRAFSKEWARVVEAKKLPPVTFHALRHSHASALIAAGTDVLTVSRRLGHGSAAITLAVYGHLFENTDDKAAAVIGAALGKTPVGDKA
jgi:integrase